MIREIEAVLGDETPAEEVQPAETDTVTDTAESEDTEDFSMPSLGDDLSLPEPASDEEAFPTIEVAGELGSLITIADQNTATVLSIRPGDWMLQQGENLDAFQTIINREDVREILSGANLRFAFGKPTELASGDTMLSVFLVPDNSGMGWGRQADLELPHYRLTGASLTDVRIRMGDQNAMSRTPICFWSSTLKARTCGSASQARM